jgi:hypothetical protein
VARTSQERQRIKMKILIEVTENAGMDRHRQLETPIQISIHESENIRKKKKKSNV